MPRSNLPSYRSMGAFSIRSFFVFSDNGTPEYALITCVAQPRILRVSSEGCSRNMLTASSTNFPCISRSFMARENSLLASNRTTGITTAEAIALTDFAISHIFVRSFTVSDSESLLIVVTFRFSLKSANLTSCTGIESVGLKKRSALRLSPFAAQSLGRQADCSPGRVIGAWGYVLRRCAASGRRNAESGGDTTNFAAGDAVKGKATRLDARCPMHGFLWVRVAYILRVE